MLKPRPVNLSLLTIRFPATAIVSILHRISGAILFLLLPLILGVLHCSLSSAKSFAAIQHCLTQPLFKLMLSLAGAALFYHLIAGIRHLLMDIEIAESLQGSRRSAWCVLIITILLIVYLGVKLWR